MLNIVIAMARKFITLCIGFLLLIPGKAQIEGLNIGIYARSEQNIYSYYGGLGLGNFYSQRTTSGYSAGAVVHTSVNYLFNAGMSLGIAEASYKPDFKYNELDNTIWNTSLRLAQWDFWGELKLGQNEKAGARFQLGGEFMFVQYRRDVWSHPERETKNWPSTRFMPRMGVGYEWQLKNKITLYPSAGMRFALNNAMGYDYFFNQFYAGIAVMYRFKFR